MEIWVDENIPMGSGVFGPHGKVVAFTGRSLARADILSADALIVRSVTRVDENLLAGTKVRFVATATIGTDHVDLPWLARSGIGFASAPGSNANSVGDYVAAALIVLARKGLWSPAGKTLGIIGHGNVGKRVERKALALGMSVLRCDPPLASADPSAYVSLEELLGSSDAVSLHVPLVTAGRHPTRHLGDAAFFAALARPILLLNTCRGEVIHEGDLLAAREAGKVARMVLDVFAGEPRVDPAVAGAADLVTPHIAGYSVEGKVGGTFQVAEAFRDFFRLPTPATGLGSTGVAGFLPPRPVPPHPELPWPGLPTGARPAPPVSSAEDAAFLADCVARAYDIEADDARLRAALREADPGRAFDRLRKEYPARHEFHAYRVTGLPGEKRELRSRLQGLGFRLA